MKKKPKKSEVEQFGRLLAYIYETGFLSRRRMLGFSLLRGIASGIGGFIGVTLGISLIIWIFSVFTDVPVLGPLFEMIQSSLSSESRQSL